MAIISPPRGKRTIDLRGPEGNAFCLLGHAQSFAKQIGYDKDKTDALLEDMQSSDYEHLIEVFDGEFGMIVDLIR